MSRFLPGGGAAASTEAQKQTVSPAHGAELPSQSAVLRTEYDWHDGATATGRSARVLSSDGVEDGPPHRFYNRGQERHS